MKYFFPDAQKPLDDTEVEEMINKRKSSFVAIVFPAPDIVDDILYPQLHKMENGIRGLLKEYEFSVLNSGTWAGENAVVLVELMSSELPNVKKHQGPPVWVGSHAIAFKSKYRESDDVFSFYVENGHYVADIKRKYPDAKELIENRIHTCALGKQLAMSMEQEFTILVDMEICSIKDDDFRIFLKNWSNIL